VTIITEKWENSVNFDDVAIDLNFNFKNMIEDDRKLVSYTGRRLRRGVPKNNNWILTGMGRKREGMGL